MRKTYSIALACLALGLCSIACKWEAVPATAFPLPSKPVSAASIEPPLTPRLALTRDKPNLPRKPSPTPMPYPTGTVSSTITLTPPSIFTLTTTPQPSATPSPSETIPYGHDVTPTPTASPTHDPAQPTLFPMSIAAMRLGSYPGSQIVVDQELDAGANYRRYYVHYLSQGLKIYALLTVPDEDMPSGGWPGIVFNHGYIPPADYRATERYVDYVDRLARSGYVVFRIDYRGHGSSEGVAQGAYGDPGYEVDVLNAVASLERYPQVNPQKIGMWGHSMGGYLTLRAMVISKDVKVGVIWAGVVAAYPDLLNNWPKGKLPEPGNSHQWMVDWPAQFGAPEQNPTFWDSISANTYLADLSGPLQLHYGTGDEEVPPQFSETLSIQVRDAGKIAEIYVYPDDNHNLSNYFTLAMDRTIAFFDAVLK